MAEGSALPPSEPMQERCGYHSVYFKLDPQAYGAGKEGAPSCISVGLIRVLSKSRITAIHPHYTPDQFIMHATRVLRAAQHRTPMIKFLGRRSPPSEYRLRQYQTMC